MNEKKLAAIVDKHGEAVDVFRILLSRPKKPRNNQTEIRRVAFDMKEMLGMHVVEGDILPIFKDLEKGGFGEVIEEEGKMTMFKWDEDMKKVAAAALSYDNEEVDPLKLRNKKPVYFREVLAVLPSGLEMPLTLPAKMCEMDAEALCRIIKNRVDKN